jgi:hypothetical protein
MAGFCVAAIEGDYCHRLAEIARACKRRHVGKARLLTAWASAAPFARQENFLAAARSGDWTVLIDEGALTCYLFDNPEVGPTLASRFGTRVVAAFAYCVMGSCGYRVHSAAGTRSVVVDQDGVVEDHGEPIPGEDTTDLHLHDMYSVLDILGLLGLDVEDGVESSTRCAVLQLAPKRVKKPKS